MSSDQRLLTGIAEIQSQQPRDPQWGQNAAAQKPRLKPINREQLILRSIDVENLIEVDHPARAIWEMVCRLDMRGFERDIKAVEGRAGQSRLDPRLLTALWIYGNSRGVGSARELSRMCDYDPGCQWLTGMEGVNHHTLADFRVENKTALDGLFVQTLGLLSAEGLIELQQVTQDGTKIRANAGSDTFRREERLRRHLEMARQQVQQLADPNSEVLSQRAAKARQRAAREKQQRLDRALEELGKWQEGKDEAEKRQVRVSTSDPEARQMKQADGGFAPSYNVQISTDVAHGIVVGVAVTQAGNDFDQLIPNVEQIERNLGRPPAEVLADAGYVSDANIEDIQQRGIELIAPVPESNPEGSYKQRGIRRQFYPDQFIYDAASDSYRCPAGKQLKLRRTQKYVGRTQYTYRARPVECRQCPFQKDCCGRSRVRLIVRSEPSPTVAAFRRRMETPEAQKLYRKRAEVAEFVHAWVKDKIGLRQFHVRGRTKVMAEVMWAILTYNIQQWIRLSWRRRLQPA